MYTIADISIWPWIYQLYDRYDNAATVSLLIDTASHTIITDISSPLHTSNHHRRYSMISSNIPW